MVYNTWQDAQHVHGILRRTTLADYLTVQPHWQTVIDYDALAKQDKQEWVANGLNCLYPGNSLCLVSLSAGGEDAETLREFDLKTARFVDHGFVSPHSKQTVSLAGQGFAPGRARLGSGNDDQVGLSRLWSSCGSEANRSIRRKKFFAQRKTMSGANRKR